MMARTGAGSTGLTTVYAAVMFLAVVGLPVTPGRDAKRLVGLSGPPGCFFFALS